MAYSSHQARSPHRQLPLFQTVGAVFGMSKTDRLASALKIAQDARKGLFSTYATHCAGLGRANTLPTQYRQAAKRDAFARINLCRKALRANAKAIAGLQAELVTLAAVPGGL